MQFIGNLFPQIFSTLIAPLEDGPPEVDYPEVIMYAVFNPFFLKMESLSFSKTTSNTGCSSSSFSYLGLPFFSEMCSHL